MKRSTKILAAVVAVVLLLTLVPAVFSLTSVKSKKTQSFPLPMSVKEDSFLNLYVNSVSEDIEFPLYPSDSLMSQRLQLNYGQTLVDDMRFYGETLVFTIDASTMTAYGLSEETAQYYINGMQYRADEYLRMDYGSNEGLCYWDDYQIGALEDVSLYFENAIDVSPKYGEENGFNLVSDSRQYRIKARIQDDPTFNFFFTTGPAVVNTDYDPSTGILYDKTFPEGELEEDMVFTFKTDVEGADLLADVPESLTIKNLSTGESKELEGSDWLVPAGGGDDNTECPITLKADFLNTLSVGNYQITVPFAKGPSVLFLNVTEATGNGGTETSCDGGEDCPSRAFTDLDPTQWYHNATDFVIETGMMVGGGDGTFKPAGKTSRAMIATILWSLHGMPELEESSGFADVAEDAWYAESVAWAKNAGYVSGYNATTFGPNDLITREQLALILQNYVKVNGGDVTVADPDILDSFTDAAETSSWAEEAMKWGCETGLFSGKGNGRLDPKGTASRAEVAQVMMIFILNSIGEE